MELLSTKRSHYFQSSFLMRWQNLLRNADYVTQITLLIENNIGPRLWKFWKLFLHHHKAKESGSIALWVQFSKLNSFAVNRVQKMFFFFFLFSALRNADHFFAHNFWPTNFTVLYFWLLKDIKNPYSKRVQSFRSVAWN